MAIAPELMLAESANVLNKKRHQGLLSAGEVTDLIELVCQMPVRYLSHRDLVGGAVGLAEVYGLTVYDALFLTLARQKSARLFTADERLADAARQVGRPVLAGRGFDLRGISRLQVGGFLHMVRVFRCL